MTRQGEYFDGGEGLDALSYSQNLNLNQSCASARITGLNCKLRTALAQTEATGSARIRAEQGTIDHLDVQGRVIATDQADTVERFVGSDEGDVLFGRKSTYLEEYAIDGGCGAICCTRAARPMF